MLIPPTAESFRCRKQRLGYDDHNDIVYAIGRGPASGRTAILVSYDRGNDWVELPLTDFGGVKNIVPDISDPSVLWTAGTKSQAALTELTAGSAKAFMRAMTTAKPGILSRGWTVCATFGMWNSTRHSLRCGLAPPPVPGSMNMRTILIIRKS